MRIKKITFVDSSCSEPHTFNINDDIPEKELKIFSVTFDNNKTVYW